MNDKDKVNLINEQLYSQGIKCIRAAINTEGEACTDCGIKCNIYSPYHVSCERLGAGVKFISDSHISDSSIRSKFLDVIRTVINIVQAHG